MKLAIMQPYLFPYLGYWQLINAVDCFVIYDDVAYIKQGYINRNIILVGSEQKRITLEVIGASSNKLINQINVGNNAQKLMKTIRYAYSKAPYFEEVFPLLMHILKNNEKNLAVFLAYSLKEISSYLGIDTQFVYSSNIEKNNNLKSQDKVIDICKKTGAKCYINSIGGQKLYQESLFEENGIILKFIRSKQIEYSQFNNVFIPNLSIIDVMMFNSPDVIRRYLSCYNLIKGTNQLIKK
ncbi:WbqC family protein [Methanolobus sp. ZRKC5]|uniref:WbqC family protein n=1 Tax=unclassified Methanolobus TaxID=2629569 RepID=UPI00313F2A7E